MHRLIHKIIQITKEACLIVPILDEAVAAVACSGTKVTSEFVYEFECQRISDYLLAGPGQGNLGPTTTGGAAHHPSL